MLPNGIIGHLFCLMEGQRNDAYLLLESGILQTFATFAFQEDIPANAPAEQCTFQVFGDLAYGLSPHIVSPFSGARE